MLEMSEVSSALRESGSRRLAETASVLESSEVSSALRGSGSRYLTDTTSVIDMSEVSSSLRETSSVSGVGSGHATAGESKGIIGSLERHVSRSSLLNSDNSSMGVACVGPAFAAVASLASASSSPGSLASCVAGAVHARRTVSPMHDASNPGGTGGLLPVQRSTSYCLNNSWSDTVRSQGCRGRTGTKGRAISSLSQRWRQG